MNELETRTAELAKLTLEKLKLQREHLAPEKEYVASLLLVWACLTILVRPESLPREIQPLLDFQKSLPTSALSMWLITTSALIGSVDGARRIALEQIPLYKAYIQVFLLNRD